MKIGFKRSIYFLLNDMFKNRLRAFLSILGIFAALLLMFVGNFTVDSYYKSRIDSINYLKEYGICHTKLEWGNDISAFEKDSIRKIEEKFGKKYLYFKKDISIASRFPVKYEDKQISIQYNVFHVNENFSGQLVLGEDVVKKTKLKSGRSIRIDDIEQRKKVIVIGSVLEDYFYDGNAVGKELKIPRYGDFIEGETLVKKCIGYEYFEIIGVYSQPYADYYKLENDVKAIKTNEEYLYFCNCYIPITVSIGTDSYNQVDIIYMDTDLSVKDIDIIESEFFTPYSQLTIYNYDKMVQIMQDEMRFLKRIFNLTMIIILAISAFFITQTMIFSIKENIGEYGIKKALGASDERLALSIVFETLGYGLIAFVIALVISIIITLSILWTIKLKVMMIDYTLAINHNTLILCFVLTLLTSAISSLFPIMYLSKKSVVDIIKFE